jgi:PAS domain S-box-containing protein
MNRHKSYTWLTKPWVAGLFTFLLLASASFYIIYQRYQKQKTEESHFAIIMAESIRGRLQQSLQYSLSATYAMALTLDKEGIPRNFDSVAAYILQSNKYIDALQLVPGGVVRYIYPLKGNEAALGYNLLEDTTRNKEAFKAITKKELFFAGPLELRQGGMAVIGRLPLFINEKFWGFSAVIIRLPTLLLAAGIDTTGKTGYYFELSKIDPNTGKEEFFLPLKGFSPNQYEVDVSVPNGDWKLSVVPVNGYKPLEEVIPISILGFILSTLGSLFAVYASKTPARLQEQVDERTAELDRIATEAKNAEQRIRDSEVKYRTLVEQATDGIFIADFGGNFLVINPAGCRLSQYSEAKLMTMRVQDLVIADELNSTPFAFDEIATGITTTSERKMRRKDGEIIDVEISANIIAPDRFLAFVRDISKRKKAENELVKSREDLRLLSNYIENIREEERLNISREIHDELGQQLTVLKIDVSRLGKKLTPEDETITTDINKIIEAINEMVGTVRKISLALRPGMLDDLGLVAALEWYCQDFGKRTGITTSFITDFTDDKFSKKINIGLFRIFQESLTNVARHSQANKADVSLVRKDQQLVLLIEDNGKGFDTSQIENNKTLGILGMKERAIVIGGIYNIYSIPGKGVTVEVVVPLNIPEGDETGNFL